MAYREYLSSFLRFINLRSRVTDNNSAPVPVEQTESQDDGRSPPEYKSFSNVMPPEVAGLARQYAERGIPWLPLGDMLARHNVIIASALLPVFQKIEVVASGDAGNARHARRRLSKGLLGVPHQGELRGCQFSQRNDSFRPGAMFVANSHCRKRRIQGRVIIYSQRSVPARTNVRFRHELARTRISRAWSDLLRRTIGCKRTSNAIPWAPVCVILTIIKARPRE